MIREHILSSWLSCADKALVYRNLVLLAENYLRCRYSVIISGLVISSEEAGAMQKLRRFAASRGGIFLDCYCWASREVVVQRNRTRAKQVPEAAVLATVESTHRQLLASGTAPPKSKLRRDS